jgi:polysaccharide biosynthesis transport protein
MNRSLSDSGSPLSFENTLRVLRRRAVLVVVALVVVTVAAFAFSKHQTKQYTATASVLFTNSQVSQQVAGLQAVSTSDPQAQQDTNVKLLQLGTVAASTARTVGHGLTSQDIRNSVAISGESDTNLVSVAATWTSPSLAAEIANTYVDEFIAGQVRTTNKYFTAALALVDRQLTALSPQARRGAEGSALRDRAQSLSILAQLQTQNVQVAQSAAVPTSASSPKVARNTVAGAIVGLLLGIALAFLLERLDTRVKEPRDVETIYRRPLLGVIPDSSAYDLPGSAKAGEAEPLLSAEGEVFSLLRAHLRYFNIDKDVRTVMVGSAESGDGKTTVAYHLAAAAAGAGERVVLIEGDLRRPSLGERLGISPGPGLSDVLIGSARLEDVVHHLPIASASKLGAEDRALDVLLAGAFPPPNPAELIESRPMEALLEEMRDTYSLVVLDTAPLTAVSDAIPILTKVDGVIVVARIGHNRRDVAERVRETLDHVGAPLLGVVANRVRQREIKSYAYAYDGRGDPSASVVTGRDGAARPV